MALKACLLAWTKDFTKDSTAAKGDEVKVTANAILLIPEGIVSHFNIPTVNDVSAQTHQIVEQYTYKRFGEFGDTEGKDVTVPEHERGGGGGGNNATNVVRLPHATLKTSKGKPRTCSIRFPGFFNLIMIGQALGTMIKANPPNKWKLDRTGKSYPFVANSTSGLMPGYQSGAWVTSVLVTAVGADQTDAVGDVSVVSGKSKASG
jgi:hypothetical protein